MKTSFTEQALRDPQMRESERILRSCVHCGFCTATCPTYLLLGDELDSPRGRIYLIKDMLDGGMAATDDVVRHIDRCLSCLSCMTTCPSGVHYMHLVDHARAHIEATYDRPLADRLTRAILAKVLPYRGRFRLALTLARLGKPFAPLLQRIPALGPPLGAMLALAPSSLPRATAASHAASAARRVVLLEGCAQPVLAPSINEAARRLLARHGVAVVAAPGEGCCGALVHHMGRTGEAHAFARKNIDAWLALVETQGVEAILITASGCGTAIKDYGHMFRDDPAYAGKAARVSSLARDITEFLADLDLAPARKTGQAVAYHSACSMQHGQKITDLPKRLLRKAGFVVRDVPEGHICCGSAGVYNILQPQIAARLLQRKAANIARVKPALVATGNIGCITQIGRASTVPVIHTVELLDFACGGPAPAGMPPSPFA
jgi:glycolate oxidase iron-sulfur subunit